jgi:hypothetical protein
VVPQHCPRLQTQIDVFSEFLKTPGDLLAPARIARIEVPGVDARDTFLDGAAEAGPVIRVLFDDRELVAFLGGSAQSHLDDE